MPGAESAGPELDPHLDRARVYRGLARLFGAPDAATLTALRGRELPELRRALTRLGAGEPLTRAAAELSALLERAEPEVLRSQYERTFEASGGLRCPPHETSYTTEDPEAVPTRTYELADIAGFYRAFGVEVAPGSERLDHVSAELEFMHLLAVKEGLALRDGAGAEAAGICRDAARSFVRDHLARWIPAFAARLASDAPEPLYATAGRLLAGFLAQDAGRLDGR